MKYFKKYIPIVLLLIIVLAFLFYKLIDGSYIFNTRDGGSTLTRMTVNASGNVVVNNTLDAAVVDGPADAAVRGRCPGGSATGRHRC